MDKPCDSPNVAVAFFIGIFVAVTLTTGVIVIFTPREKQELQITLKTGDIVKYRIGNWNPEVVIKTKEINDVWYAKLAYVSTKNKIQYNWQPTAILEKVSESNVENDIPVEKELLLERIAKLEEQVKEMKK